MILSMIFNSLYHNLFQDRVFGELIEVKNNPEKPFL